MEIEHFIQVEQFCLYHDIDPSVLNSLHSFGLVEYTTVESTHYLYREHTGHVEKLVRMHYELGINMEGIDVVSNLLNKITSLQEELRLVKNRLRVYERD